MNEQDLKDALLALASGGTMRSAGIDEAFAELFARNMQHFDMLPESTQTKIRDQFARIAWDRSMRESVGRKHSEERDQALARWLKGVNLLLAVDKTSRSAGQVGPVDALGEV